MSILAFYLNNKSKVLAAVTNMPSNPWLASNRSLVHIRSLVSTLQTDKNAKATERIVNTAIRGTLDLSVRLLMFPWVRKTSTKDVTMAALEDLAARPIYKAIKASETVTADLMRSTI